MGVAKIRGRQRRAWYPLFAHALVFQKIACVSFIDDVVGFTSCINLRNSRCVQPRVHLDDVSISSIVSPLTRQ